jgi:thiol-disulfide isomerase/thioredoxin
MFYVCYKGSPYKTFLSLGKRVELITLKYDIARLRRGSEAVHDYVTEPSKAKEAFDKRCDEYKLDPVIVKELKNRAKDYLIIVFSGEWCPDCVRNVPVLDLLAEATGIEVRIFGHIIRDAKSNTRKWAVPPSPPEVEEFNVVKIPLMVVLKKDGEKMGEIIENPPPEKTLEHALLDIMK